MNDFLQNILNSDITELKKDFSLLELYTVEAPSGVSTPGESPLVERSESLSGALVGSAAAVRDLNVVQLKPISIKPEKKNPQIVNVKQTFRFPNNFITKKNSSHSGARRPLAPRNMYSQTSKTIMELYETQKRGNNTTYPDCVTGPQLQLTDSGAFRNHRNVSYTVMNTAEKNCHPLEQTRVAKPVEMVVIKPKSHRSVVVPTTPYFVQKKKRPGSRRKYTRNTRSRDYYSTGLRSPKRKTKYPCSKKDNVVLEVNTAKDCYQEDSTCNTTTESTSSPSNDSLDDDCSLYGAIQVNKIIDKLQDNIWEVNLHGIYELMEIAGQVNWKKYEKHMTIINRKMIDFLKSPRSSLCRSACQATGELFRVAKSTKRPEFDEIVDILLCKTADLNRFIQKDANVALDKLVTYIPISHTVRALSARGPGHKNPLVRTATARLLVCICALSGLDPILGTSANPRTRKAILAILAKFLTDKNLETRKYGERLYKMLRKHKFFNEYFYKDMDNSCKTNLKRILKDI